MLTQIKVGLAVGAIVGSTLLGWQVRGWKDDADKLDETNTTIEVHNDAVKEIEEVVREVEVTKIEYRDRIIRVPSPDLSGDCPVDELTELRNQVVEQLDPDLFHRTDPVPTPTS